jgi:glutathionyl-hydroquinone reductase
MITLHDAIKNLYSNADSIYGDDVNTIKVLDKDQNTILINESAVNIKLSELQAAEVQAKQTAEDAKASALAKLTALGLTADEIKALVG